MKLLAPSLIIIGLLLIIAGDARAQNSQPVDTLPGSSADVSLRDYETARIDNLQRIMDERDKQYAQRFEAQQKAVADALQAAKEAVANALLAVKETTGNTLAAADKAVAKAELANEKRFESQNEFRQTLTDQATQFMTKAEADARQQATITQQKALEDDVARITARIDEERSRSEGASNLWLIIVGIIGVIVLVGGFAITLSALRQRPIAAK